MTRIMTNVAALNAQRNLQHTSLRMGKTLEKLASGYRINRAADDAAGLGISEKMRAQIRGNKQALRNVQDGISMLQTAEGAMDEVHSMLQRIRELAVQAANGTYADNGPERTSIGQEIVQLANEIDRIAMSTEFNGQKLLTGNLSVALGASGLQNGAYPGTVTPGGTVLGAGALRANVATTAPDAGTTPPGSYTIGMSGSTVELRDGSTVIATADASSLNIADAANGNITFSNGLTINIANTSGAAYTVAELSADLATPKTFTVDGTQVSQVDVHNAVAQAYTFSVGAANTLTLTGADGSTQTIDVPDLAANEVRTLQFGQLGVSIVLTNGASPLADPGTLLAGQTVEATGSGPSATLQVGANVPDTLSLFFTNLQTIGLGGGGFFLGGPSGLVTTLGASGIVATIEASHNVMTCIDGAIQTLNTQRGTLGAAQNRLEHSIRSLGVAVENLSASESRIRDADVAELSSEMVSNQILQSAGVSVLAQANQTPQSILQLLQG